MKEFIEKLIVRLEEELNLAEIDRERWMHGNSTQFNYGKAVGYENGMRNVLGIVNQLAEEYNDGWIPCGSGELPAADNDYLGDYTVDVLVWDGITYFMAYYDLCTDTWIERNREEECENKIIAWKYQQPYQPKGE